MLSMKAKSSAPMLGAGSWITWEDHHLGRDPAGEGGFLGGVDRGGIVAPVVDFHRGAESFGRGGGNPPETASTTSCTATSKVRTVPLIVTSSGDHVIGGPPWIWVTLTTAERRGSVLRLTTDWSAVTIWALTSTGSMLK